MQLQKFVQHQMLTLKAFTSVFLSKYAFGSLISLLNISTLKSKITLLDIHEPALSAVNVNEIKNLSYTIPNRIIE